MAGDIGYDLRHLREVIRTKTESGVEEARYSLFYKDLPDEYKILAEKTLNETAQNKEKGLRKLKEFMKRENLSCSDDTLITVLRSCKYNIKKSESKLKRFLKSRRNVIEKLCRVDDEKLELILDDTIFSVLPHRDKSGRAVLITKPTLRLDEYSMDDVEPVAMSLILYLLSFPLTTVCGISYIAECECDSILVFYPIVKAFRAYLYYTMDFPIRAGRADVTNENFLCRLFFNAVRSILPEKYTKRVFFNGNSYKTLHEIYHPDFLPKNFGGNMAPINDKFYRGRLKDFIQKLKEEGQSTKSPVI